MPITRDHVIAKSADLPTFPLVIERILSTLEDPDANLNALVSYIEHDPVVAGHVLSMANKAGTSRYGGARINDIFTAISLIGLARVREAAIVMSLSKVFEGLQPPGTHDYFWRHSVAVGVCSVELAHWTQATLSVDTALIAGLLHDVGQLWLQRFEPSAFNHAMSEAVRQGVETVVTEREALGIDHCTIGGWLAQSWGLSEPITSAIVHHHTPEGVAAQPLAAVVHVAEVLSNALDLTHSANSRVTRISAASCATLGLQWGDDSHRLFGRIEARSRQAAALFVR